MKTENTCVNFKELKCDRELIAGYAEERGLILLPLHNYLICPFR